MTRGYTHSEVFAQLKMTKEEVKQNFTSYQWLSVLDHFIESALDPIATAYPALSDLYHAKVVAWQAHRPSIKFSMITKTDLPIHLFNSLTTEGATKREHQKKMLLNRGLRFGLISLFIKATEEYLRLHDPLIKMPRTRRRLLLDLAAERCGSQYLYAAARQVRFYAAKAHWFKGLIVQKYTRLALMSAKRTYEELDYQADLNEVIQTYLVYLAKAIDRCDARQGVLTTFIQTWFYSAKAEVARSVVEQSKTSSWDNMLESSLVGHSVEEDRKYEVVQHLCVEAKRLDPQGSCRQALGIPEAFSSSDIALMRRYVVRETLSPP